MSITSTIVRLNTTYILNEIYGHVISDCNFYSSPLKDDIKILKTLLNLN